MDEEEKKMLHFSSLLRVIKWDIWGSNNYSFRIYLHGDKMDANKNSFDIKWEIWRFAHDAFWLAFSFRTFLSTSTQHSQRVFHFPNDSQSQSRSNGCNIKWEKSDKKREHTRTVDTHFDGDRKMKLWTTDRPSSRCSQLMYIRHIYIRWCVREAFKVVNRCIIIIYCHHSLSTRQCAQNIIIYHRRSAISLTWTTSAKRNTRQSPAAYRTLNENREWPTQSNQLTHVLLDNV